MFSAIEKYSPCSFKDIMVKQLSEKGLPDDMIEKVMGQVMEAMTEMRGRWEDKFTQYPETFLCVVWANVKAITKQYITDHAPRAWFAVLFEPGIEDVPCENLNDYIDNFRNTRNKQLKEKDEKSK